MKHYIFIIALAAIFTGQSQAQQIEGRAKLELLGNRQAFGYNEGYAQALMDMGMNEHSNMGPYGTAGSVYLNCVDKFGLNEDARNCATKKLSQIIQEQRNLIERVKPKVEALVRREERRKATPSVSIEEMSLFS